MTASLPARELAGELASLPADLQQVRKVFRAGTKEAVRDRAERG
jgi:hypothetical protein